MLFSGFCGFKDFSEHIVSRFYYNYSESKRDELRRLFGSIVHDIESIFLRLSPSSLELIFDKYGLEYGRNAERYARSIYPKWKKGEVRPNLENTQISDEGLEYLNELTTLKALFLMGSKVTGKGCRKLKSQLDDTDILLHHTEWDTDPDFDGYEDDSDWID